MKKLLLFIFILTSLSFMCCKNTTKKNSEAKVDTIELNKEADNIEAKADSVSDEIDQIIEDLNK